MMQRLVRSTSIHSRIFRPRYFTTTSNIDIDGSSKAKETNPSEQKTNQEEEQSETACATELNDVTLELKQKNSDLSDRLLRALAETENVRRIAKKDVQQAREFAISKFAKSILDVADNLNRAIKVVNQEHLIKEQENSPMKSLFEGVVMTEKQMEKVFNQHGLAPVGQVGDKFDPNLHDAMFEYEDPTKEAGTIGELVKVGYLLNGRILRPAQVGTIKKKNE